MELFNKIYIFFLLFQIWCSNCHFHGKECYCGGDKSYGGSGGSGGGDFGGGGGGGGGGDGGGGGGGGKILVVV